MQKDRATKMNNQCRFNTNSQPLYIIYNNNMLPGKQCNKNVTQCIYPPYNWQLILDYGNIIDHGTKSGETNISTEFCGYPYVAMLHIH